MPTLVLTPRFTPDAQALWRAAIQLGWSVHRLHKWIVPDELKSLKEPVLYLEGLMSPTLATQFGKELKEPPDDWLPDLPMKYKKRNVSLVSMREARKVKKPLFIKPPNDKSFPALTYWNGEELPDWIPDDANVLVCDVVRWTKEFRCFILDRTPLTLSIYLRDGKPQRACGFECFDEEYLEARDFVVSVLQDKKVPFPRAACLDVGVIKGEGWAVVEQNAVWASGLYGCDPKQVLKALRHA